MVPQRCPPDIETFIRLDEFGVGRRARRYFRNGISFPLHAEAHGTLPVRIVEQRCTLEAMLLACAFGYTKNGVNYYQANVTSDNHRCAFFFSKL